MSPRSDAWKARGTCATRRMDPALFTLEQGASRAGNRLKLKIVQAACAKCPVRVTCLEHALEHHEHGIWAGTTDAKRGRIRTERARELKTAS